MEYYVGLDMGTNSVGWAVTDTSYNLIRVKGKDFWGVREFDEASSAVDRRNKRTARRRRQREVARIGELRLRFEEEIMKKDPLFFVRMENSKYHKEDKDSKLDSINAVFDDADYKDANYYEDYPTIFHLRKQLIEDKVPIDDKYSRLVYLALLNMYKHRGHFLNQDLGNMVSGIQMGNLYEELVELVGNNIEISLPSGVAEKLESILGDDSKSRIAKSEAICELCNITKKDSKAILLVKMLCGLKVDGKKLFDDIESDEKIEIEFKSSSYNDNVDGITSALGEERFQIIDIAKQIYDIGVLTNIRHGKEYLSYARVESYEKHKKDLDILKQIYRDYLSKDCYEKMFKAADVNNYSAYIGTYNSLGQKVRRDIEGGKVEDFYSRVEKDIKNIDDERVKYVLNEIKNESFMPKQMNSGNGVIPNQVHKREMIVILNNAEKYLPFLTEVNPESGLKISEEILEIFSFQIPYYVGPLSCNSSKNGGNGWVCRKEPGKVLPWNMNEKIDMELTREEFIRKLIRECTYLSGEKVMPKCSLAYEKYSVLNEINNIKILGEPITVELKKNIYNDLFCKKCKVSRKDLVKYLIKEGYLQEENQMTGIDININNSLSSYNKFYEIFGDKIKEDKYYQAVERIIEICTIYGDSKKMIKTILKDKYNDILNDAQIKRILGFRIKDWGNFSKQLLELRGCNKETWETISIMDALWETNDNFMQIINDTTKYDFKDVLEEKRTTLKKTLSEFTHEDLATYYFSAPVKRMINQTMLLLKEIIEVMGESPKRVFIEMTRSDDEKKGNAGRKDSRSKQLIELYKNIKDDSRAWKDEIKAAGDDGSLRSKKLFLYYMQMGRCMYTGKPIDLAELFTTKYDIDHIYPRCFVKDDNISNNLVLVEKEKNARKSDEYPLRKMSDEVYSLWNMLHAKNLMSDEKYARLTSRNPLTEEQKAGFIARQLVETSQGTKGVADLLKQLLPDTTIVYAKGGNVSDFRKDNGFIKSRTVNDFHHAKDAYLNIVVGNVYYVKFTQNPLNFIKKDLARDAKKYHYHLGKMFDKTVERDGETAWIVSNEFNTISTVNKVMEKNTPMITRLTFEAKGAIANETLYPARKTKAEGYIPLKTTDKRMADISKYGGFTNISGAYFMLVEHEVKNKRIRTLEMLPIYVNNDLKSGEKLAQYCEKTLGLKNPSIRMSRIKIQSLVKIDGFIFRLSGRTGNRIILRNEVSMCFKQSLVNYIHLIDKYIETKVMSDAITADENLKLYDELVEKHLHGIFSKRKNPVGGILDAGRDKFISLSLDGQCKVISEILKLSAIAPTGADLTMIGGAAKSGVMLCSKEITKASEFVLINQSITGLFTSSVDLLTL